MENLKGFVKGEKSWALRENDNGKPLIYLPHQLIDAYRDYLLFVKTTPIYKKLLIQKTGEITSIPCMRPMTTKAFCLHAGIAHSTFIGYSKTEGYTEICAAIKDAIWTQKFEGASVGVFSSAIIIRELGLTDNVQHVLDDKRKSVDELFPKDEQILEIKIEETTPAQIQAINKESNIIITDTIQDDKTDK